MNLVSSFNNPDNAIKSFRFIFLDIIRIIAITLVVIHHLVFHLSNNGWINKAEIIIGGVNLGNMGVSIFIFISGITLTLSSNKKHTTIKNFYINRFKRLYPLFWLIYFSFFIYYQVNNYLPHEISPLAVILAFAGLDGYLISFVPFSNWYLLGEWFFGFIVILYIIFPLLFYIYKKNALSVLLLGIFISYISTLIFNFGIIIRFVPIRLMEFTCGMFFAKIILSNKWEWYFFSIIICIIYLFVFNNILHHPMMLNLIKLLAIDILFLGIIYFLYNIICKFPMVILNIFNKLIIYLSDLSFIIFLVHHIVIVRLIYKLKVHKIIIFDNNLINIIAYIVIVLTGVLLASMFFYWLDNKIKKFIAPSILIKNIKIALN